MGKVRVACFGQTLDGFSAGADQSLRIRSACTARK